MRLKIGHKVFIALALSALLVLVASAVLTRWSFQNSFLDYVNELEFERAAVLATRLSEIYAEERSWDFVEASRRRLRALLRGPRRGEHEQPPPGARHPFSKGFDPSRFGPRVRVLDAGGAVLGAETPLEGEAQRIPIDVDGKTVGYVAFLPVTTLSEGLDVRFAERQLRATLWISIGLLLFASLLAAWLARQLVAPVRSLAQGTRDLTAGRYDARMQLVSHDELGELASDFNVLAETLQRNRRSQQEWLADMSHELRTPLAVLRAELLAVEDGVRRFDANALRSLIAEVDRLSKLIDDLDELSRSDSGTLSYRKEPIDLAELVGQRVEHLAPRFTQAGLALDLQRGDAPVIVFGDARRLEQLCINLLENSLSYTDSGGAVHVLLDTDGREAQLLIDDSPPGVPAEALPRLFDRLYRVERSRSRASGGAGLGLAIARNIVTAHGGRIEASAAPLGGLRICVRLPLGREAP